MGEGIDETGLREMLGTNLGAFGSEASRGEVFSDLIERKLDQDSVTYVGVYPTQIFQMVTTTMFGEEARSSW